MKASALPCTTSVTQALVRQLDALGILQVPPGVDIARGARFHRDFLPGWLRSSMEDMPELLFASIASSALHTDRRNPPSLCAFPYGHGGYDHINLARLQEGIRPSHAMFSILTRGRGIRRKLAKSTLTPDGLPAVLGFKRGYASSIATTRGFSLSVTAGAHPAALSSRQTLKAIAIFFICISPDMPPDAAALCWEQDPAVTVYGKRRQSNIRHLFTFSALHIDACRCPARCRADAALAELYPGCRPAPFPAVPLSRSSPSPNSESCSARGFRA